MRLLLLMMMFSPSTHRASVVDMMDLPSERLNPPVLFAPGAPPVLGFRYLYAVEHGRAADLGLMADDAGH